jgi:hypothetical protein
VREDGAAKNDVHEIIELDVPREAPPARDQSLIFDPAHAPADVWSHAPTISRSFQPIPKVGG